MKLDYTLEEIISGLDAWTELVTPTYLDGVPVVNNDVIISYLNQGFCFRFTYDDFQQWSKKNPESIHAYPAIFAGRLKFVLIDSASDFIKQTSTDDILVKDFFFGEEESKCINNKDFIIPDLTHSMPLTEALHRNFSWKMYCRTWLDNILLKEKREIFKAISIPFSDCFSLFENSMLDGIEEAQSALAFFGLNKNEKTGRFDIEFILTNEQANYNLPVTLYDISRPVPPFGGGIGVESFDFNLLPVVGQ